MEANKDYGTSVGFTKVFKSNNGCITVDSNGLAKELSDNPNCFHILENFEIIDKQQWEDIWNKFSKECPAYIGNSILFFEWLQDNYNAPDKK